MIAESAAKVFPPPPSMEEYQNISVWIKLKCLLGFILLSQIFLSTFYFSFGCGYQASETLGFLDSIIFFQDSCIPRKLVLECITSVHMLYWLSANIPEQNTTCGISLMGQCLRLLTPNERGLHSIPGQGTISHMPQLRVCIPQKRSKVLRATINTWHSRMNTRGTSLVIQCLGLFLAVQGTQVWSLVRELRCHLLQGTQALVPQLRPDRTK